MAQRPGGLIGRMPVHRGVAAVTQVGVVDLGGEGEASLTPDQLQQGVDLRLEPLVILLRRRRADMEEVGQANDLSEQLQEPRLPVLEPVACDTMGAAPPAHRRAEVLGLGKLRASARRSWKD